MAAVRRLSQPQQQDNNHYVLVESYQVQQLNNNNNDAETLLWVSPKAIPKNCILFFYFGIYYQYKIRNCSYFVKNNKKTRAICKFLSRFLAGFGVCNKFGSSLFTFDIYVR